MMKNCKGITLITLALAITIMAIIATTLVYNINTGAHTRALNNMYKDVEVLRDRVDLYFSKFGTLPIVSTTYTNIDNIKAINVNDNDIYYVIDLEALENITLSFGKGYQNYKTNSDTSITDVYVVNEKSHNVYYIKGIKYDNKMYYTVPGQYTKITTPDWSDEYTETKIYTDTNGNTAWIPKGFQVSLKQGENTILGGLVIRNATDKNEFVWIPTDLVTYKINEWNQETVTADYQEYYVEDVAENTKIINDITKSVSQHKGYYISRYEAGLTTKRTGRTETSLNQLPRPIFRPTTKETPIYAYNCVTWNDVTYLANNIYNKEQNDVMSRLISARSWDTALKFIETVGEDADSAYPLNAEGKGWYSDNKSNNENLETGKSVDITNKTTPNKLKNIYDMAGNLWEWSSDRSKTTANRRLIRRRFL